jgi:hypothetical protein
MSGADKEYKFGPKNNWRRSVWNQIKARLRVPAKDALVLYLAGPGDYDREVAVSKGFRAHNLISVERNSAVLSQLREKDVLTIRGDFVDAVRTWPAKKPFDVVFGDFCGDLSQGLLDAIGCFAVVRQTQRSVFAFNFQRGRDATLRNLRAKTPHIKHRGELLAEALACVESPSYLSYRSGTLLFDSVVYLSVLEARRRFTDDYRADAFAFLAKSRRRIATSPLGATHPLCLKELEAAQEYLNAATVFEPYDAALQPLVAQNTKEWRGDVPTRTKRSAAAISAIHTRRAAC